MSRKRHPTDILDKIQATLEAWKEINSELKIGDLTRADLEAILTQGRQISAQFDAIEAQLTNLRNQREQVLWEGWQMLKRFRSGIKGIYGDDSSQYEMAGGTRVSGRKSRIKVST